MCACKINADLNGDDDDDNDDDDNNDDGMNSIDDGK